MMMWCMVFYGLAPMIIHSQTGNLAPNAIQIDGNANLFATDTTGGVLNGSATLDWVKDSLANTDTPSLIDSIAIGIDPNVTGATGGTGHWNGTRIVDGIGGNDQDIFLTGGKENDTSTWNVGPGSVGSSKYDITQAYIANNQTSVFFGMERRGNNGTTAFDFEFNQTGTAGGYVPTRTLGDVLLTFEMQGSGGSGSATPHIFQWDGSSYVELTTLPAGVFSSINSAATPPAPWGYVDSKGNWVLTPDIPRFEFAEAVVPLSILPGVNGCGGNAFVQVRTRSSSTANSDLKDTTKIFRYSFGGPTASGSISADCTFNIGYDGSSSTDSSGGSSITYSWQFQKQNSNGTWSDVGSPVTGKTGTFDASGYGAGKYRAVLTVTEGGAGGCTNTLPATNAVDVFGPLSITIAKDATTIVTPTSGTDSSYTATIKISSPATGVDWQWLLYDNTLSTKAYRNITGATGTSLSLSLVDIFAYGSVGGADAGSLSGFILRRGDLLLKVHGTRQANSTCQADSNIVTLSGVKGIDP